MPEGHGVQTSLALTGGSQTLARTGSLSLVQTFRSLLAVPSVHYQPAFAVAVAEVFARTPPAAVAIELAEEWSAELEWGASCWPAPVASHAPTWGRFLPVVPGDSILEAYRLARESGVPVLLVDRAVAGEVERADLPCLDGNLAPRVGERFQSALDALQEASGPPAAADLAREADMAWSLAALMREHESVLWVGGMAHWTRIRDRIERGDFTSPVTPSPPAIGETRRYRLDATALHRMTAGRLPWLVARYARDRAGYDERDALRDLSLDAVGEGRFQAIEVAAMLTYARNLAALRDLRETPDLWDLITAASASLDERYVGRLVTLALRNRFAGRARDCALMSWGRDPERPSTFRSGGENVEGEPVWRAGRRTVELRVLPRLTDFRERRLKKPYSRVRRARSGDKTSWVAMPGEEAAYEAFVRYLLEHAEVPDPDAGRSSPFVAGLGDGVDVRATIRRWHEGKVYVREHDRTRIRITNGLIDFDSDVEASDVNLNDAAGHPTGWVDPSLLHVGSVSWEIGPVEVVQSEPAHVTRRLRRLSLLTLDVPTYLPRDDTKSYLPRPVLGNHVPHYLAHHLGQAGTARVALLVIDGMAIDQWRILRDTFEGHHIEEHAIFSWIPTLTQIGRQAIFSGRMPLEFATSIEGTHREAQQWSNFWQDRGLPERAIQYIKPQGDGEPTRAVMERLSEGAQPHVKVLGGVIGFVDQSLHHAGRGTRGLHAIVDEWAQSRELAVLVDTLVGRGFSVFITSDHGNAFGSGIGKPDVGVTAQQRGDRAYVFRDRSLRDNTASRYPRAITWPQIGLPPDYFPLLAPYGACFMPEGKESVSHGGIALEEVLVPFVRIAEAR